MADLLHIVYSTDEGYLKPTLVAAASALHWASARERMVITVLDTGITEASWKWFETKLRTRFGKGFGLSRLRLDVAQFRGFKIWHGSFGAYARILIPNLLPDVKWCVYCDGDTLFTDDPFLLEPLMDDTKAYLGHEDWLSDHPPQETWFPAHGCKWDREQYVCSGFILMNLAWFRENDGVAKCMEFLARNPDPPTVDQDALAAVCQGHVGRLPDRWGQFSYSGFAFGRPGCIHYAGDRPWDLIGYAGIGYTDMMSLWYQYARRLLGLKRADLQKRVGRSYVLVCILTELNRWRCRIVKDPKSIHFAARRLRRELAIE